MLQKAVEHMEGKMKNMLDDYLHKNQPNLSTNQIKDVENEISQQLEQEVEKQFMSQSNQITKDLETEINDETEEGILNKLKDKIDSAGNNIKDSMGNMMESIEKKVLNKHGVNISEERKINNEQPENIRDVNSIKVEDIKDDNSEQLEDLEQNNDVN